jgi:hypothetical protein
MKNTIKQSKSSPYKGSTADRRWTLLFMGNRGRTITFRHFKGAVMTVAAIMVLLTGLCGWFVLRHRDAKIETQQLEKKIENLNGAVASLRNEKDILTARLVVAESRVEETLAKVKEEPPAPSPAPKPAVRPEAVRAPSAPGPELPQSADAQNFIVYFEPEVNTLGVEYRIVNTGSKAQPLTGRTVVILKDESEDPANWLILPAVPIIGGQPTGDGGKSFSIYNFRTMRFKVNDQSGPEQYKTATVYVFAASGTLLLEKDFTVGVQPSAPVEG